MELFGDFSTLSPGERHSWCAGFYGIVQSAFREQDDNRRLLGNLLVLERYLHTLEQGLGERKKAGPSPGLRQAVELLWSCLEGHTSPLDFQDFANDLDACVFAHNVGGQEAASQEFWDRQIGEAQRTAYEWLALEWAASLLMELVSIAGGRVDDPDKEAISQVDLYGICDMLDILEDACTELAGISVCTEQGSRYKEMADQVYAAPLFQQLVAGIQDDLKTAIAALPEEYAALREAYSSRTILPAQYAAALVEY